MSTTIRNLTADDQKEVMEMMRVFYASDAVFSNGSDEIFANDITYCLNNSPYLEGYIFEDGQNIQGYAMVAKSFSTEFGKPCMWIEDLYIKDDFRGFGIGKQFMEFIKAKYTDAILRLEVEEDNERAVALYKKSGFTVLPYMEMKR